MLRTRTLTGCYTCRERKLKCDDGRPACQRCNTLGLQCQGYAPKLSWVDSTLDKPVTKGSAKNRKRSSFDLTSRRRPLFTDRERLDMVQETQKDFLYGDQDRNIHLAIENIDSLGEELSYSSRPGEEIGPFGVFLMQTPVPAALSHTEFLDAFDSTMSSTHAQTDPTPEALSDSLDLDQDDSLAAGETVMPWLESVGEITLPWLEATNNEDPWQTLTSPLLPGIFSTPDQIECYADSNRALGAPDFEPNEATTHLFAPSYPSRTDLALTPGQPHWSGQRNLDRIPRSLSNMENMSKIPSESRFLLEHYFTEVVDYMCHLPNPQSPWRTIHFPCAMSTMADLLVFGNTNHARMALFYALLSVSANHLNSKIPWSAHLERLSESVTGSASTGNYWLAKGSSFQNMAAAQIQACLQVQQRDYTDPEVYKELLMSLLSMVTISVTSGRLKSADVYLQQAKRVIDIHGRSSFRSGKVVALHRIYSYLHIIYTSTQVSPIPDSITLPDEDYAATFGPVAPLDWPAQDQEQDSQFFARTYGVPRSLLTLISRTSAAALEIEKTKDPLTSNSPATSQNWQSLEDEICNWAPTNDPSSPSHPSEPQPQFQSPYTPQIKSHLVKAMHNALIVMFFRRVRPINRIILQHYVESAADQLNEQEEIKVQAGMNAPALLWPWFMVAAEAIGESRRRKLRGWAGLARRYGGRNLEVAEQVVLEVWRRCDHSLSGASWVDVVREWDVTLVLT